MALEAVGSHSFELGAAAEGDHLNSSWAVVDVLDDDLFVVVVVDDDYDSLGAEEVEIDDFVADMEADAFD